MNNNRVKYIITIEVDDKVSTSIKFLKFLAKTKQELLGFSFRRGTKSIDIKTTIKITTNE